MATLIDRYGRGTGYITLSPDGVPLIISGATFKIDKLNIPSAAVQVVGQYSASGRSYSYVLNCNDEYKGESPYSGQVANESVVATVPSWTSSYSYSRSYNTSSYFSSSNPTERVVAVPLMCSGINVSSPYVGGWSINPASPVQVGNVNLTLNAPPTFTAPTISFDTPYVYSGLTTASVTVSDVAAKYGGNIVSVAFTIGNQTVTRSDNGTLSILLDTGGVFTPTVTVTDSRGQTTTKSLDPITVNVYTAPSISFDVARTLNDGTPDDEGTYGLIEAELTFSDVVATAVAPSVVLTDDDGTQTTPSVTWYTDSSLTTQVTWANVSSGDTVYGLFSGLSTQHSYQVSVRPRDSEGTGTAVTQTIAPAFYTIDFYAGGHGIAFGRPANSDGFYSAMTAEFEDTATFGADVLIDLPEYQTASTTDKEIYDAIVALGWDSDVLIP